MLDPPLKESLSSLCAGSKLNDKSPVGGEGWGILRHDFALPVHSELLLRSTCLLLKIRIGRHALQGQAQTLQISLQIASILGGQQEQGTFSRTLHCGLSDWWYAYTVEL